MKIRIKRHIPVEERCRPIVGETYEVIREERGSTGNIFFIEVNGQEVGVFKRGECEVVPEAEE